MTSMEKNDPEPESQPAGDKPPPRPPRHTAVGFASDGDGFNKNGRATITKSADGEGKFERHSGGRNHYGHVIVKVKPNRKGKGVEIIFDATATTILAEYIGSVVEGVRVALDGGAVVDRPLVDIIVHIVGGSIREADSSDLDFKLAGIFAINDAIKKADPIAIE